MSQQAERRVGTIIGGKWRVDALLGSGSMAAVYAVTHRNGARAALKILHPTLCTDPAVCERFLGEGYLANSVKHSGIVRVLDDGVTDDGCVFLTMDLLEGDTLEALRQKRGNRIPIPETLDLADKLMDVLAAVHAAGIIHRDLKPQNVFICDDGTLKLLDFGVARVFDRTSQSKLSMFGLVLGTPSFMSPEQALGSRDKVDHRSDIWSLGATIFTALTGETVHLGANVQARLLAAATVKARSITMVMPELPGGIAAAIDMALRFKKEDRWQSVDAMRRALREARESAGLGRAAQASRTFDMSLDESTHVDKGGPGALDGLSAHMAKAEPVEGPSGTFIGIGNSEAPGKITSVVGNDGSVPPAGLLPSAAAPAAATPGSMRPPMKSIPPPLPARANMKSIPPGTPGAPFPPAPPGSNPGHVPHGPHGAGPGLVVATPAGFPSRRPPSPDFRASRPDGGTEGSIPATGNTLNFGADESISDIDPRLVGGRRKGTVGVWLMAVLLAAAALGGIAFFAVKRGPLAPGAGSGALGPEPPGPSLTTMPNTTSTAPVSATATPPPTITTAAPSAIVVPPPPIDSRAGVVVAAPEAGTTAVPTPVVRAPSGGSQWKPSGGGGHAARPKPTAAATAGDPPPAPEPPKPTPPGLAPDPFGTPE